MVNEKVIQAFIDEGKEGVYDYYEYEHVFEDGLSDAEKEDARERLIDEFMTGITTNAELRQEIGSAMLKEITDSERGEDRGNKEKYIMEYTQDPDSGDFYNLYPEYRTDEKRLSRKHIMDFLEKRFKVFSPQDETPSNGKNMLFEDIITAIKKLPGFDYYRGATKDEVKIQGGQGTDALKDILRHFAFRGKTINKPDNLPINIRPKEIEIKELLTTEELVEMKNEIETFITNYGYRSNLTPLLKKIGQLTEKSSSRINMLEVDQFIGKLDLSKYARRENIYALWADKKTKGESNLKEKAQVFKAACKELIDNSKEIIDPELQTVIENYLEADKDLFNEETPRFSYIMRFDTDSEVYQKKFKISTVDDTVISAKQILFDFLQATRPDALQDFARQEGLSEELMEESFQRGSQLRGYETFDEGKSTGQTGVVDYGNEAPEVNEFAYELDEFGNAVADPLFFYIYQNSSEKLFNRVPVFKNRWDKIKNEVRYLSQVGGITNRDDDLGFKDLTRYLDKINDEYVQDFTEEGGNLYLPLTPKLKGILDASPAMKYPDNDKEINKYLQSVNDFIDWGRQIDRTRSPTLVNPQQAIVGGTPIFNTFNVAPGVQGRSRNLVAEVTEDLEEWAEAFQQLLEAIVNYYIKPNRSRLLPFDEDAPRWSESNYASFMALKSNDIIGDLVDSMRLIMQLKFEYAYDTLDDEPIEDLVAALELHSGKDLDEDLEDVVDIYEDIWQTLVEIYASVGDVRKEANIELGASLHENLSRNQIQKKIIFNGKPTSHWAKLFEDAYPKKNDDREKKERGVAIFPLEGIIYLAQSIEFASVDADSKETDNLFKRFMAALRELPIAKSEVELKILETHDIIRKMENKPVYFNTRKVDNFTHVNGTLDTIEKRYNVNLTPFEIEGIVDETDSHKNISKAYGVSTEVVYYVKGSFR